MHVGELAARELVERVGLADAGRHGAGVDLARAVVLAAVVVGDREVERGLGVARVEPQRGLERLLGVLEPALGVIDRRPSML